MTTTLATSALFAPVAPAHIVVDPHCPAMVRKAWDTVTKKGIAGPVLGVKVYAYTHTNPACDSNCYEANTYGGIRVLVSFWRESHKEVGVTSLELLSARIERDAHHKLGNPVEVLKDWLDGEVDAASDFADEILTEARAMVVPLSVIEELRPKAIQQLMETARGILDSGTIMKNDTVEVFKGRKVPVGTKGVVKWIGTNHYGTSVGILVPGKDGLVFTAYGNCQRVNANDAEVISKAKQLYLNQGYDELFGALRG